MNNTKTPKPGHARRDTAISLSFRLPQIPKRIQRWVSVFRDTRVRVGMGIIALVLVAAQLIVIIEPHLINHTYALGSAGNLLESKDAFLGGKLVHDVKNKEFNFNANFKPGSEQADTSGGPTISAVAHEDPAKGLRVSDPITGTDFTIKPASPLLDGRQDGDRVVYPLRDGTGWLVYTMRATSVKEDIVLDHANGNTMVMEYELALGDMFEAHLEKDGSVGVYGSNLPIGGQVSTSSEKDAELLTKARKKAAKDTLMYSIPAPVAYGPEKSNPGISVHYELAGSHLKTVATNLKKGKYPLTIDPTVTVTAQTDLFRDTNPESNTDFNATSGNISRGAVTGGVIPAWTTNANNNVTARLMHGGTIYDDYAYVAGGAGNNSTNNLNTVEYARLSTVNSSIGTWGSTTALPTALSRFQLIAYNGYLYAVGGATATTNCATVSSAVYYTRIQTNGQLSGTWNTASNALPAALCGIGAAVYNGKMYVAGGRSGSATTNGVTTVYYASFLPNGDIGSWTTEDSVLPAARYDADLQVYNGYLYIIGGSLAGTPTNTVLYAPLAADGSVYGTTSASWKSASSFGTPRNNLGSTFSATNDGFMYVQGGCATFGTQSCTAIRNEIQVAQINGDGSLGPWSDVATTIASLSRVGNTIQIWRGTVYSFAGCTSMVASTMSCTSGSTINTQSYSKVSTPGQVGPLNTTTAAPVTLYAHGAAVNNGFLYIVGGCITNSCQTGTADTTGNVSYAALNADGTVGAWTTDSTNRVNGATGLGWFSLSVFNNYLYVSGGYNNNGNGTTGNVASSNIYYVKLNANGSLASGWTTSATALSSARYSNSSVAYRGFLFVFGGCTNTGAGAGCLTYQTTTDRFTLDPTTGAPSARQTSNATVAALPTAKAAMAAALYNGYVYLAGGAATGSGQTDVILYARITDAGAIASWINGASGTTGTLVNVLRRASAVAINGYLYVVGGHDGGTNTTYGDIEIGKINVSTGNIDNNFTNSVIQVTPRWDGRAAFANGYIYNTGGCSSGAPPASCGTRSSLNEYVEVFNAGNKGTSTWSSPANVYTTNRGNLTATAYEGYIYIAGGCTSVTVGTTFANGFCSTGNNTTAYAALNPDGSIGAWTAGPNLTASNSRVGGCLVADNNTLYYVGGEDSSVTAVNSVLYSQIGGSGVPGSWAATTTNLTGARAWHGCTIFADRIYVTGGEDSTATEQSNVLYSPDISAGGNITGSWTTSATAFTGARAHHVTVAVAGYLFVIGGDNGGTNALFDVQSVQLSPSTGALTGSWQYSNEMPQGVSYQSGYAANGYIYLFGGRTTATNCINNTYVAAVNTSGRLGQWSQAVNNFTTARFGAAEAFYNGYYYVLGGHTCSALVTTNVIQAGGQQSQAMKALLSKYADLNGNGKPWKYVTYLTNAVNGGVDIEKWRLRYKSSFESTNSWGATTTVAPLTNQATYTVSALDASSANIKLARWWFFAMDINMETSFAFTDDTQPTIFQYGFYYSPPPAKRLMHGRDFRDQTQQGLDAHP